MQQMADDLRQIIKSTTLYLLYQDGKSEHVIWIIVKRVKKVIINNQIPVFLWPKIFKLILKLVNITSILTLKGNITLYKAFINQVDPNNKSKKNYVLSVKHLRILGTKVYILIQKEHHVKNIKTKFYTKIKILVG